jgi:YVTN family beta-propeller protein
VLLRKIRVNPGEPVQTMPGMPPVLDAGNLYSGTAPDRLSPAVGGALSRVYVPNRRSNSVYVIDPSTLAMVDRFPVGASPQHVVPSWDLKTLWVANNGARRSSGSLTPIDPKTGKPGTAIPVDDPYNLYFTPDGRAAIVVAERHKRLDFRDPQTMALQQSVEAPNCSGINHADFSIDGRYAIFTCEFRGGGLVKIDLVNRKVLGYLRFPKRGMPQDIRIYRDRLYPNRDRHARTVPEPRRQGTVRRQPRLALDTWQAARQGQHRGSRFRDRQSRAHLADPWRRQPRYGQCQRGRKTTLAVRPVRQRRLRHQYGGRLGKEHSGRPGAARPDGMAAARPLLARPHRQHALAGASVFANTQVSDLAEELYAI